MPCNPRHRRVEQRQISKQNHMVARAVRNQNRCRQAAHQRKLRHDFGIAPHRQRRHQRHRAQHHGKHQRRSQQMMPFQRRQYG